MSNTVTLPGAQRSQKDRFEVNIQNQCWLLKSLVEFQVFYSSKLWSNSHATMETSMTLANRSLPKVGQPVQDKLKEHLGGYNHQDDASVVLAQGSRIPLSSNSVVHRFAQFLSPFPPWLLSPYAVFDRLSTRRQKAVQMHNCPSCYLKVGV